MQEKNVFSAGEIGEDPNVQPPFPPSICGTYSCHGIEPAYDEVDRSDVVIAKINQDKGEEEAKRRAAERSEVSSSRAGTRLPQL